jgi:hypothetical protein
MMKKTLSLGLVTVFVIAMVATSQRADSQMLSDIPDAFAVPGQQVAMQGNTAMIAITILCALIVFVHRVVFLHKLRHQPKAPISDTAAQAILITMCRISQVGRDLNAQDIVMIRTVYTRMTGRIATVDQICDVIGENPSPLRAADIRAMSAGLTPYESALMLKIGIMMTVTSDTKPNPSETMVMNMAKILCVTGDDLLRIMNQVTPTQLSPAYQTAY